MLFAFYALSKIILVMDKDILNHFPPSAWLLKADRDNPDSKLRVLPQKGFPT